MDDELEKWMTKANVEYVLGQLRRGNPPPAKYLAACPRIERWSTSVRPYTVSGETRPEVVVAGRNKSGVAVCTGAVRWIDCRRGWVLDTSALYRLGKPSTTYKDTSDA